MNLFFVYLHTASVSLPNISFYCCFTFYIVPSDVRYIRSANGVMAVIVVEVDYSPTCEAKLF